MFISLQLLMQYYWSFLGVGSLRRQLYSSRSRPRAEMRGEGQEDPLTVTLCVTKTLIKIINK
jgi:hypothetical protein